MLVTILGIVTAPPLPTYCVKTPFRTMKSSSLFIYDTFSCLVGDVAAKTLIPIEKNIVTESKNAISFLCNI